jgi:hypothetical protein
MIVYLYSSIAVVAGVAAVVATLILVGAVENIIIKMDSFRPD